MNIASKDFVQSMERVCAERGLNVQEFGETLIAIANKVAPISATNYDPAQDGAVEFTSDSLWVMAAQIKGKTIKTMGMEESRMDNFLVFKFTDGSILRLRFDYLYDWEVTK
jgi:hypothetical protein